ncbi:mechanosensitive ion channel family protein [Limibacter armeniacum]|uniref:mechanosensitive ion channel family protein n=1 Tax=Limibacter armeniacum TaxID=466084 RepID=UPI002FE5345F
MKRRNYHNMSIKRLVPFILLTVSVIGYAGQASAQISAVLKTVTNQEEGKQRVRKPIKQESFPDDHEFYKFKEIDGIEFSLSSPYHTLKTHFDNLSPENFHPEIAAQTIVAPNLTKKKRQEIAQKLFQIYLAKGKYFSPESISRDKNYAPDGSSSHKYTVFEDIPEIYLVKKNDKWVYADFTVSHIDELIEDAYPLHTYTLVDLAQQLSNQSGHQVILGLKVWQYLGIALVTLLAYLSYHFFLFMSLRVMHEVFKRFGFKHMADRVVRPTAKPIGSLLVYLLLFFLLPVLQLPMGIWKIVTITLKVLMYYALIKATLRLSSGVLDKVETRLSSDNKLLERQLIPVIRVLTKLVILVSIVILALDSFDYDVTGLLAGISIGGLALALAAQDTLKHLFGSLMIFIDKPFKVGDWVVSNNVDGTVEEVGFRSTRIRTFHDSVVSVPNGKMSDLVVDNMGSRKYRRFNTKISITYDTPPDLIEVFVKGLEDIVMKHPNTRKDFHQIHLNSFGASSLDVLFYIFFEVPDWGAELKARHEVMLEVIRLADDLNIRFAFPTQTLHMETFPGQSSLTPTYEQNRDNWVEIVNNRN